MRTFKLLFFTLVSSLIATNVVAQPPGHWVKIQFPKEYTFIEFGFADTAHGILFCQSTRGVIQSFITSDGGINWQTKGFDSVQLSADDFSSKKFSVPSPYSASYSSQGSLYRFHRDTLHGAYEGLLPYPYLFTTLAQKMYDTLYGYRLINVNGPHTDIPTDTVRFIVTHDGWDSFADVGTSFLAHNISTATMVDSTEAWIVFFGRIAPIIHVQNQGHVITTHHPDTTTDTSVLIGWNDIVITPRELYVRGFEYQFDSNGQVKYRIPEIYSSIDNGGTWHSTSKRSLGSIYQLSVPAPGRIWAFGGLTTAPILYFSSNDGTTWVLDNQTFQGDTLLTMHWLDENHGWVTTYNASGSNMYVYVADPASVRHENPSVELLIQPNPATNFVLLPRSVQGVQSVQLQNILGETIIVPVTDNRLDIHHLPPGVYFISIGAVRARFIKQ